MIRKTKTFFIFSLVYLTVSVAAFALVTSQVNKVGAELEERVQVVANSYAKEVKYNELNELVEETTTEREELKKYLISEEDTIVFLAEIEKVGAEQDTSLTTDSLDVSADKAGNNRLTVKLRISGKEERVMKMLHILENLPYQSEVRDLSLTYGVIDEEGSGSSVKLNVTIDLLLF